MENPMCEICGEDEASLQLSDCGACDDCARQALQPALRREFGREVCCEIMRRSGSLFLCLETAGTEHDHSPIR